MRWRRITLPGLALVVAVWASGAPAITPSAERSEVVIAGTGFFIAPDGSLLTAAHVVPGCRRLRISAPAVGTAAATVVATDATQDVALLRAAGVRPPAILAVGAVAPADRRLIVLGFPSSIDPAPASTSEAALANDRFPASIGALADMRETVWLDTADIGNGFSGGPIVDPRSGVAMGLLKGVVDARYLTGIAARRASGMAMGPGAGRLARFVSRVAPSLALAARPAWGTDPRANAARATVRVLCWR